jgi:hypothetical protein
MDHQNPSGTDSSPAKARMPMPVTPSSGTERPEGLAFNVIEGADLAGVPKGDQTSRNPAASSSTEQAKASGWPSPRMLVCGLASGVAAKRLRPSRQQET